MVYPLKTGDRVALIAPSSPISDGSRVDYAVQYIKSLGLAPVLFSAILQIATPTVYTLAWISRQ